MGRRQSDKESLLLELSCAYVVPLHMFTFQEDQSLRAGVTEHGGKAGLQSQ